MIRQRTLPTAVWYQPQDTIKILQYMEQRMGQFKTLVTEIVEMQSLGMSETEIARVLQVGRSVVEYALEMYGDVEEPV